MSNALEVQANQITSNDKYNYVRFTYLSRLPWIFPGAPLTSNGAPRNIIESNLTALDLSCNIELHQLRQDFNMVCKEKNTD